MDKSFLILFKLKVDDETLSYDIGRYYAYYFVRFDFKGINKPQYSL
ncbi:Uncharacterised protein [Chryseobacterium indologenes]|nr:Uncharacterised protein [Chryseobacterium indologenes]